MKINNNYTNKLQFANYKLTKINTEGIINKSLRIIKFY